MEPHDVDVDVEFTGDKRYLSQSVADMAYGRDALRYFRRGLVGSRRGVQFAFNRHADYHDIEMTLLWQRGDTLQQALARLQAIAPDPSAGRAARTQMLPVFEGLEEWIPRLIRGELIKLAEAGAVQFAQVQLAEGGRLRNRQAREQVADRWKPDSPLRRAAVAALADLEARGVDLRQVYLHGLPMIYQRGLVAAAVGMRWRHVGDLVMILAGAETQEWTEVVRPTRTRPLLALRVTPKDRQALAGYRWPLSPLEESTAAEDRRLRGFPDTIPAPADRRGRHD